MNAKQPTFTEVSGIDYREQDGAEQQPANDPELLQQAAGGSQAAFKAIYDKYWFDLFQAAYKRTRHADDARDLVQDLFIALWDNPARLLQEADLGGYLFVALRNRIFNYFEKKSVRLNYLMEQPFKPVESEEAVFSSIRTREIKACVAAAVAAMPPRMKEIYMLSREQQLSVAEIAGLLGIAPQTVKNQLHTALGKIRTQLNAHNLGSFIFLF
jgi:RNA polymerase sigma-70 factor (ECF subfamily)